MNVCFTELIQENQTNINIIFWNSKLLIYNRESDSGEKNLVFSLSKIFGARFAINEIAQNGC